MSRTLKFNQIVGTGGIGTGILFELADNRSLSRNETRLAALSPTRDYCKQHIILHYIARILAPDASVHPIGLVGADDAGRGLLRQMREAGMEVELVGMSDARPTMYCVCMQYPDKAVCNVTTSESACSLVDREYIARSLARLPRPMGRETLIVAAPEVPVEARLELLERGHGAGAYCVSSCLVDEFDDFCAGGGMEWTDLLVINEDEAAAFCKAETDDMAALAEACARKLQGANPNARLAMTCGAQGSWVCEGKAIRRVPALPANVVATGGAGDAYTAGTICALALGVPFLSERGLCAPELGAKLAAEAIGVSDTIDERIDADTVRRFLRERSGEEYECGL